MTHDTTAVRAAMAPLRRLARAGFALAQTHETVDVHGLARRAATPPGPGGAADAVRVVAGIAGRALSADDPSADAWVVTGSQVTAERAGEQTLTADEARAVADLCRRADAALGGAHELQWVMSGGRLLVVAATPLECRADALPAGTWLKDTDRYPEPFTALGASVAGPAISAAFTAMLARHGALLERADVVFLDGEAYLRTTPAGGRDGGPPPAWLLAVLARTVPALRERIRRSARTATGSALAARQRHYEQHDRPALQRELSLLRTVDIAAISDPDLWRHLSTVIALVRRALTLHFDLIPAEIVPVYELVQWSRRALGWDERATLELLAGSSPATSSPTRALAAVAHRISTRPGLPDILRSPGSDPVASLAAVDPTAGELLAAWMDQFGSRPLHDDPGSPLFEERPDLVAGLVLAAMDRGPSETTSASPVRERARAQLAGRASELVAFERVLAAAERAYRIREDSALWTGSLPAGLVRRAAVECGRRLVAAGRLDDPEDAVHLPAETLLAARPLDGTDAPDLRAAAAAHRAARERARAHPGPARYGPPPADPPDVRLLPEPARTLNAALLWSRPAAIPATAPSAPAELSGVAGSAGRYTGPVCRVLSEADFARVRTGDVVVCRTTDPAWSVLFGLAGALVTDTGGLLSHAGIVAREFHLPAVLGTGRATSSLVDGQLVTVDGTTGHVRTTSPRS